VDISFGFPWTDILPGLGTGYAGYAAGTERGRSISAPATYANPNATYCSVGCSIDDCRLWSSPPSSFDCLIVRLVGVDRLCGRGSEAEQGAEGE